ncbi:MAG: DUF63 family protein [Thermoplasmata archaeon]|nr:DUF63 family protein [Thermoplasmata archaeon]
MKKYVVIALTLIAAFSISVALFPHELYDEFLWKYIIGPVIADATGHPVSYHGITAHEGYSFVSEIIYAVFLLAAVYILYLFFERIGKTIDAKFFAASLPFILLGSFGRILEDAGLFKEPVSFFFISPLIYIQIGFYFSFSIAFGLYIKKLKYFVCAATIIEVIYIIIYSLFSGFFAYLIHPVIFLLFIMIAIYLYAISDRDYISSMYSFGLIFLIMPLLSSIALAAGAWGNAHIHMEIFISIIIAGGVTALIYIISKILKSIYHNAINSSLIFSHGLDAFTTYIAVSNPFGFSISYGEKHPLPSLLLSFNGISYPTVKMIVILLIIYGIEELKKNLKNAIKFMILFIGLAPGLRDFLRILLGI